MFYFLIEKRIHLSHRIPDQSRRSLKRNPHRSSPSLSTSGEAEIPSSKFKPEKGGKNCHFFTPCRESPRTIARTSESSGKPSTRPIKVRESDCFNPRIGRGPESRLSPESSGTVHPHKPFPVTTIPVFHLRSFSHP